MTGLLLHLSGPMQSWGTHSYWNERDTLSHPTRSGLIGILAAAMGHDRDEPLDRFAELRFTIRIDRPGHSIVDFHTVGGGRPREQTPPTAGGGRRQEGQGTIVSHRRYLTDAAFTVAVTGADPELIGQIQSALRAPVYEVHLGRRSCPPAAPLVIGRAQDPISALLNTVPLARQRPKDENVAIEFIAEQAPTGDVPARSYTHGTRPVVFGESRTYLPHTTWHTTHSMPATLCVGLGSDYLDALIEFSEGTS